MTREEALNAMLDGKKVRHELFTDDGFIYMRGEHIHDENNYNMWTEYDEFWESRKGGSWENGWTICGEIEQADLGHDSEIDMIGGTSFFE